MGTITGKIYRIGYQIETLAASVNDPPTAVTNPAYVGVNAASPTAAITALASALSINASTQRLSIIYGPQELPTGDAIYS